MKRALTLVFAAFLTLPLSAVEYVTLSTSSKTVTVAPNALVEVVGFMNWGSRPDNGSMIEFTFANGDKSVANLAAVVAGGSQYGTVHQKILNQKFTSLTQVRIFRETNENLEGGAVTLKITPANEIDSAGPKTVLVIPEGSTGDYDVVIESSGDMVTWTPMHSQGVTGSGPQKFFRTRIVKR